MMSLRPITSSRASITFGASDASGSSGALVSGGSRVGGGMTKEARQLALQLGSIIDVRLDNKSDLWTLNERLADYVEKTRFLDAQNRHLVMEADILKAAFSSEAVTLKARYQVEIEQIIRLIEESEAHFLQLTSRIAGNEGNLNQFETELLEVETSNDANVHTKEQLIIQLGAMEKELATLRRKVGDFDTATSGYRGTIQRLRQEESDLRKDLDQERMVSMVAQTTASQLKEELSFLLEMQEAKTTEMTNLAYRDTTDENRALWKTEFSQLFSQINSDYMNRMEEVHSEATAAFQMRLNEQQSSSTKDSIESRQLTVDTERSKQQIAYLTSKSLELTTRIAQFESQLTELAQTKERIAVEYQEKIPILTSELQTYKSELEKTRIEIYTILDNKLSLELEVSNYAKLLEAEEIRIDEDIHSIVEEDRQVKELMVSRGIYDAGARFNNGGSSASSFQIGSYFGGSDYNSSFATGFGGGYGGSYSYYSSG